VVYAGSFGVVSACEGVAFRRFTTDRANGPTVNGVAVGRRSGSKFKISFLMRDDVVIVITSRMFHFTMCKAPPQTSFILYILSVVRC